ncbi:hypothetical protein EJ02DRAFT_456391 [Clathrospora elynae]|uniref:C2H2-type domain-containing protein n=1 Tax=Clathrospora elynae TaxID=706981 RepID=A0A6A5SK50_9PLEO|nr:hypothetical protein EJ02DRAFT_456391 [Clathrospora elynae]
MGDFFLTFCRYASRPRSASQHRQAKFSGNPTNHSGATGFTAPCLQPISDQANALRFNQTIEIPIGYPLLAQPNHSSGYQYNCSDIWYNNPAFDDHELGASFFDAGFRSNSMGLLNGESHLGLDDFQMYPAWMTLDSIQDITPSNHYDQTIMPTLDGAQLSIAPGNHHTQLLMPNLGGAQLGPAYPITAPAAPTAADLTVERRMYCPKGCPQTFRRAGDYRRHMKKHTTPCYKCAVFDCDMTFYRADKLRDHLKQGHKDPNLL